MKCKYLGIVKVSELVEALPYQGQMVLYYDVFGNQINDFVDGTMKFVWSEMFEHYELVQSKLITRKFFQNF